MAIFKYKLGMQGRFIVGSIVSVTLIIAVISFVQLYNFNVTSDRVLAQSVEDTKSSLLAQAKKRGKSLLDYLSVSLINPIYQYDLEATYNLIKPLFSNEEIKTIVVFDDKGKIFHDGVETIPTYGEVIEQRSLLDKVLIDKEPYLYIETDTITMAQPILISDKALGGVLLVWSLDSIHHDIYSITAHINATADTGFKNIVIALVITAATAGLAGILVSIALSRSLIVPIQALVKHTQKIVKGDFDSKNKVERDDEIGELASAFNEMGRSLKRQTQEISFLAYHDSLTKLPNRNQFFRQLSQLISRKETNEIFSVLFLDLDEFKFVNDNYGHETGDQLLCDVAERIAKNLRGGQLILENMSPAPEFVARIGGDEFLICLPDVADNISATKVANRLIQAIQKPIQVQDKEIIIAASIGIANYPNDGTSAEELIKNADIAMYKAKSMGKNTFANFDQLLNLQVKNRMVVERDLRKAIDEGMEQFELWFQPQFALNSTELVGAEALIRWRHPEKGLVPPDEFIGIAEECGLIIPIGDWVIDEACEQLKIWQKYCSEKFHLAVNLSARQVYRSNLVEKLDKALRKHQLTPDQLHAEVTESILIKDESVAKNVLDNIRELGIQLWLDDFGTGYSSLSYLRSFDFDGVKIDRSFVSDIEVDNFDRALTSAVIDMAKGLNIAVVAEGVETKLQAEFLAEKGCDIAQGYYYSKPLPAFEFETEYFGLLEQRNYL
ncbi:EAL domain-containing protein [Vibrio sp. HN007]|uniref:EAL domain-containing protein n=1 Tax=Vibrio iocasae TaxID=3098914 RepID=UPI0035D4A317